MGGMSPTLIFKFVSSGCCCESYHSCSLDLSFVLLRTRLSTRSPVVLHIIQPIVLVRLRYLTIWQTCQSISSPPLVHAQSYPKLIEANFNTLARL